jgi:hypothetical protein
VPDPGRHRLLLRRGRHRLGPGDGGNARLESPSRREAARRPALDRPGTREGSPSARPLRADRQLLRLPARRPVPRQGGPSPSCGEKGVRRAARPVRPRAPSRGPARSTAEVGPVRLRMGPLGQGCPLDPRRAPGKAPRPGGPFPPAIRQGTSSVGAMPSTRARSFSCASKAEAGSDSRDIRSLGAAHGSPAPRANPR